MSIKKKTPKMISMALCAALISGSLLTSYATSVSNGSEWTADEGSINAIEVTYRQASTYNVVIPKTISFNSGRQATYSVSVSGDIDTNKRIYVAPIDGIAETEAIDFYMKEQTPGSSKADVVATVTHQKSYWTSTEVASGYAETNNSISAPGLTAGVWKGTFQMAINLESCADHAHDYAEGVCTVCGKADPSMGHVHNYVDGICTICGNTDTRLVAPESAYGNWNYTLDDVNDIITLNYYAGNETNVIVYGNYPIGEKTYKTRIASNASDATNSTKYMFNGNAQPNCKNIQSITFSSGIDTSNVTDMSWMFYNCTSLTSLDLTSFNTSKVTDMSQMFNGCSSLTSLDLTSFNTSKVTDMCQMFFNCSSLTSLDLTNFNTGNVTNMSWMFYICTNLKAIYATSGKWTTAKASTTNMFSNCGTSSVTYR